MSVRSLIYGRIIVTFTSDKLVSAIQERPDQWGMRTFGNSFSTVIYCIPICVASGLQIHHSFKYPNVVQVAVSHTNCTTGATATGVSLIGCSKYRNRLKRNFHFISNVDKEQTERNQE